MLLTYSFNTALTSGYVKAMERMSFKDVLDDLVLCGRPISHPMLLPILTLCHELSAKNDKKQRDQRAQLRKLDDSLIGRYSMTPAAHYGPDRELELDSMSKTIAKCQTEVLQKRPQAWRNVVDNARAAMVHFWDHVPVEKRSHELKELHDALIDRLNFLVVKLQGIENYAHVTLERLGILREVVRHADGNDREKWHMLTRTGAQYYQPKGIKTAIRDCYSTTTPGG